MVTEFGFDYSLYREKNAINREVFDNIFSLEHDVHDGWTGLFHEMIRRS
jgi:hypothetical protein